MSLCIAPLAINLINKLLQVDRKKRYRVTKALHDPWLQVSYSVTKSIVTLVNRIK